MADEIKTKGGIIIPQAVTDKSAKTAATARIMDTKQLARHLMLNSYTTLSRLDPATAFNLAEEFAKEQARRFPNHETADGQEKDVTHV